VELGGSSHAGLEAHVNAWTSEPNREPAISVEGRYDPKHHRIELEVVSISGLPVEWGLVIGDIAHNFRKCLDHIAWALVERGRTPPATLTERQRNQVYFPIHASRLEFNAARRRKLPGVRRADIAIVRRYQPYHGGNRAESHLFAILNRLSNDDKHRNVQPALMFPQGATYDIAEAHDCVVTRIPAHFVLREALQVGTKLAPVYVRKTGPNPNIEMSRPQLLVQPILQQGGGVRLEDWVKETRGLTARILRELSDPPTELLAKLGGAAR
jgi:hypothetical protein